ncbi:MAG: hypothetical protein QOD77_562 [Thermoplasmata archaeon]|jgi:hypothetical protein|nr:hypothetical protein [Thermoplasmata archaeon]
MRRNDEAAVTPVGVILLVGITVALVTLFFLMSSRLGADDEVATSSGGQAIFNSDGYRVQPTGPMPIPVEGTFLRLTIDGNRVDVPLSTFQAQLGGATEWRPGTRICIAGHDPLCYVGSAVEVAVEVYTPTRFVFAIEALRSQEPAFKVGAGTPRLVVQGDRTIDVEVIGAAITCGANGPTIPVTAAWSQNGGASWSPMAGGAAVDGGETAQFLVASGTAVGIRGTAQMASCGNFFEQYDSIVFTPHVEVLAAGDPAPNVPAFGNQQSLEAFMQPYVNTQTQTMVLDANQLILLFEFVDDLQSSAADFQDLVVVLTFT